MSFSDWLNTLMEPIELSPMCTACTIRQFYKRTQSKHSVAESHLHHHLQSAFYAQQHHLMSSLVSEMGDLVSQGHSTYSYKMLNTVLRGQTWDIVADVLLTQESQLMFIFIITKFVQYIFCVFSLLNLSGKIWSKAQNSQTAPRYSLYSKLQQKPQTPLIWEGRIFVIQLD